MHVMHGEILMPSVEVRGLKKTFREVTAVDNLSFEVRNGEIYGLLGPNGAGKTTTLKVLMGLLDPDSGSVRVMGVDSLSNPLEVKSLVGYVPEETVLYESLTPRELFEFIASVRGISESVVNKRISEKNGNLLEQLFEKQDSERN
jgi:ABC-2 type transport system ATP-binding protein